MTDPAPTHGLWADLARPHISPAEAVGNSKAKVAYVHAGALHEVEKIRDMLEARVNVVESFFAELSPALAVHTGPGTAGLCFYPLSTEV